MFYFKTKHSYQRLIEIADEDEPGLILQNITPKMRRAIVDDRNVPARNQRKSLKESFDLIRIKEQIYRFDRIIS